MTNKNEVALEAIDYLWKCADDEDCAAQRIKMRKRLQDIEIALQAGGVRLPPEPPRQLWAAMGDAILRELNLNVHHDAVASVVYNAIRDYYAPRIRNKNHETHSVGMRG
jgi:hypothetical protein